MNFAESPPARVAWIETLIRSNSRINRAVATREGGVDRNFIVTLANRATAKSPPARVAWIETLC